MSNSRIVSLWFFFQTGLHQERTVSMFKKCTVVVADSLREQIEGGSSAQEVWLALAFVYDVIRLGTLLAYGEGDKADLSKIPHGNPCRGYVAEYFSAGSSERDRLVSAMMHSTEVVVRITSGNKSLSDNIVVDVRCYDGLQASLFWSLQARFESGHVHIEG